ncbi:methenyltetrahydrofolate synthetase [Candidatus Bathyarchaeota archaeon B24-2]|nr:MAG: methenyltetrahydrofolate synthetase [Candidatus Bathyarchaeota archaeon B24-2]
MNKEDIRKKVWAELRKVAKPDSRFHWNFSKFIPDYEGSDRCAEAVRNLDEYKKAKVLMITPDNNLEKLREYCILDGKVYIMPTYGIVRGFILMRREFVPLGQEAFSATLDGADRFGKPITLSAIKEMEKIDLMVTGASIVNVEGVRYGKGHGYFDIEWAMLREIKVVDEETPIVAVTHDCQVTEEKFPVSPHDTIIDIIVTPTRVIRTTKKHRKPQGIIWDKLPTEMLSNIPPLQELREMRRRC